MRRRRSRGKNRWVSDDEIERWVEEEQWAMENSLDMMNEQIDVITNNELVTVPSHGSIPEVVEDGIVRMVSVQVNSMSTARVRNRKAAELQEVVRRYNPHLIGIGEVGINWNCAKNGQRLLTLFPELEKDSQSATAHNSHLSERIGVHQMGGVGQIIRGELLGFHKRKSLSKDFRNLGRWVSTVLFSGHQGHTTRVIQAYRVRSVRSKEMGSMEQQHIRYMQKNGLQGNPTGMFDSDLLNQLQVWQANGDRLILIMDANEHVLTGKLCRQLADASIELREVTKDRSGSLCPNTHASGSIPIDGVWATPDIDVVNVKWLSFDESPGDHRACLVDFTSRSVVGTDGKRIVRPACRRLTSSNQQSVGNYFREMERQWDTHHLEAIELASAGVTPLPPEIAAAAEKLDRQAAEIQRHCEKHCRKIYRSEIPCSPEVSLWDKRGKMFTRMLSALAGRVKNPGVLYKKARKLGIQAPRRWTEEQIRHGRHIAKAWKRRLSLSAPSLRTDHLTQRLIEAEANGDTERATAIRNMLSRESNSNMWSQLSWAFKDNGGRANAVSRIERVENGVVVEYTAQEDIERVVREETQFCFSAAASSPFCQGLLGEQLGYLSDTTIAASILDGSYVIPPEIDDATALLIDEIGRIGQTIISGSTRQDISPDEFSTYWRRVRESTSSSYSGVHFGHYVVAGTSERFANFFAKKISLTMRTGWAPSRWGIGLTVLLEKIAGVALVNKTRAILLMEGDYNMHNQVIFGDRMMTIAREHDLIPDDQYAEKESDGQDGAFMKRLVYDFSRLMKIALGIVSEDASNCYDRIAHPFCSLVFQAFGVAIVSVIAMLSCIQRMRFYLRTAFGESPGFMTALLGTIIQGLCQGNAASPAGWSVVCAILLAAYNQGGHGAKIKPPIRGDHLETAGVLHVDDVDLFTMDADLDEEALWTEIQSSTLDWSGVLIGSGGTAKGEKCFGYLADYTWDEAGQWHYAPPPTKPLVILLPDGTTEEITVLPCDVHQVTLGVASSPDGNDQHHLAAEGKARDKWKSVRTKAEVWVNRLKNAHLPSKYVWVSYRLQLWSSVRYSLGVLSARLKDMTELCPRFAFEVLPYLGINRRVRKGWRYMHSAFGGFGLLDLATEVVISRVNLFLQHWDNPAPIGKTLRACMQALQLQCGCQGCPLAERFYPMGELCDHSWVTSFWECVSAYSIMIEIDYPDLPLPRANDQMIMQVAISLGYTLAQLRSVNRCRISSCSLFLSDIASADGRRIDPTRALPDVDYSVTSAFDWPIERPSAADWRTWQAFLLRLSLPDGTLLRTLEGPGW